MQSYHSLSEYNNNMSSCVITVGMFDGVHAGHISVLKKVVELSKQENIPSVVFTFSNHPTTFFDSNTGYSSLTSLTEKKLKMEKIGINILIAIPFDKYMASLTAHEFARTILCDLFRVSHIVFGYDNHFGQNREGSKDFIDANFPLIQTHRVSETIIDHEIVSSSIIKKYLNLGDVERVTQLLTYPFTLFGTIIKGDQLGRTIGFPTANLQVTDFNKLIPARGVYLTKITIRNEVYYGMTNIGIRPTVSETQELRIETHVFNFDLEIYGDEVSIEFISRLRDEKKFDSFSSLVHQLNQDKIDANKMLAQIHVAT
jgi:riboflavin kinase/FMN adenylyltransferase